MTATPHSAKEFDIVVPGSIANLGPGFDTLAVAVTLYLRLHVKRVPGQNRMEFHFVDQPLQGENYIERAFRFLVANNGNSFPAVSVDVHSEIPMRAGLGSSAAATVAGLRLYETLCAPLAPEMLLKAGCALEGHPENAAASLLGGLTASCELQDGSAHAVHFRWPDSLGFVVLTPRVGLATSESRGVLPNLVSRSDAVFNLQRLALLLKSLEDGDLALIRQALHDRLHQPFRQAVVPGLQKALDLEHEALLGVCLSGAGPSLVALAVDRQQEVAELLASNYRSLGIDFEIRTLEVHQPDGKRPTGMREKRCDVCA
jgi:homoserine kinase